MSTKYNEFGIVFFKPNKATGRMDFIPESEVDFSKQFCLLTDKKWPSLFSCDKAHCKDWEKYYVYCPDNEEALNALLSD